MRRLAVILALAAGCGGGEGDQKPRASFVVGFWHESAAGEQVALADHATLESGTRLGMVLRTDGSCEVYVVLRAADGAVLVLHPGAGKDPRAKGIFEPMPPGTKLDGEPGLETVHVVASRERQEGLAKAVAAFHAAAREGSAPASEAKAAASAALLDAIQEVRKRHEGVAVPAPRPALLAGRVRGDEPVFEHDVETVLCRTYTIDHR